MALVSHGTEDHDPAKGPECCASHEAAGGQRYITLCLISGALLAAVSLAQLIGLPEEMAKAFAAFLAVVIAFPLFMGAYREVWVNLRPATGSLTALAVLALLATQKYEYAGWLALILVLADQFVRQTAFGAQRAIERLVGLTPDIARLVTGEGAEHEVTLAEVRVGATVRVKPGENLPVDGTIIAGRSTINQASLTGEAVPIEAETGDEVYAGTTNLTGAIDLRVTSVGEDTTIGKVGQLIREAESSKTPRQLLIEQVASFFVPVALSVAFITWYVTSKSPSELVRGEAATRAVTVLVVSCPMSLLLASPAAMVAAFASAARLGILVKQTSTLEAAANIDAVVFDKTGTITTGVFEVSKLAPATGVEGAELLKAAADAEQHSNHPLAQSILKTARAARVTPNGTNDYEEIHGRGVRARTAMGELHAGRSSWLLELSPSQRGPIEEVETKLGGMSGVHVMRDGKYLGAVGLEDQIRPNTKSVMNRLRELGVRSIAIFTGDRLSVAERVGRSVGVDAVEAECHPEEKHEQIKHLVAGGYRTLMVGDGINDGPSLAEADVGVAMGLSGSDVATNSAGVALMTDDLRRIPFLMELARKTRLVIGQNIAISIVIVIVGLVLSSTGLLAIPAAALYHFVGEVFVLANSFRLFRFGEEFAAEDETEPSKPMWERREASIRGLSGQPASA
ncbi:MAG: cation-translocating P-type ATPase [Planctomycetota bacterium]